MNAMLLSAALAGYAPGVGRVLVLIFWISTTAVGGWLTGQWITSDLD
jgi:hypothetical protein